MGNDGYVFFKFTYLKPKLHIEGW